MGQSVTKVYLVGETEVVLRHHTFSGERVIQVNSQEILRSSQFLDSGDVLEFVLPDGRAAEAHIHIDGSFFRYDLFVGDRRIPEVEETARQKLAANAGDDVATVQAIAGRQSRLAAEDLALYDVQVSIPQAIVAHSGVVKYRVHIRASMNDQHNHEWFFDRRYSEFANLHAAVLAAYIGTQLHESVPRLPDKKWRFFQDHLDPIFIEERRTGLQQFLRSLIKFPRVSLNPDVRSFFETYNLKHFLDQSAAELPVPRKLGPVVERPTSSSNLQQSQQPPLQDQRPHVMVAAAAGADGDGLSDESSEDEDDTASGGPKADDAEEADSGDEEIADEKDGTEELQSLGRPDQQAPGAASPISAGSTEVSANRRGNLFSEREGGVIQASPLWADDEDGEDDGGDADDGIIHAYDGCIEADDGVDHWDEQPLQQSQQAPLFPAGAAPRVDELEISVDEHSLHPRSGNDAGEEDVVVYGGAGSDDDD